MKNVFKGLICMFVYPILSVLSVGLAVCAVISFIGGIARTFGSGFHIV